MENEGLVAEAERQAQTYWDFMPQGEREQYAWLAGIIDGEGAIFIARSFHKRDSRWEFSLRLRIGMTDEKTIRYIRGLASTGGVSRDVRGERQPFFIWEVSNNDAAAVLRLCLPFLITKKEQAVLAIKFNESRKATNLGPGKPLPIGLEEQWQKIRKALQELNPRGKRL